MRLRHCRSLLASLALSAGLALPLPHAANGLEVPMPIPTAKPERDADGNFIVAATLANGLAALDRGATAEALTIRDGLPEGSLDREIMAWSIALAPGSDLEAPALADHLDRFADWPGLDAIRANFERALYKQNPAPRYVLQAFATTPPETLDGRIALARAMRQAKRTEEARRLIREIWLDPELDDHAATVLAAEFEPLLSRDDHLARMNRLLYRDQITAALMPARKAGAESLYQAWVQTIRAPARADAAIDAVDAAFKDDPALIYLKIRRLRELNRNAEAAALFARMPDDAAGLVDPAEWWIEQRIVSRGLFEAGDAEAAYRVAVARRAQEPAIAAEAAFHAGWYALRGLNDPAKAERHFRKLGEVVTRRGSKARAAYWLGRALGERDGGGASAAAAEAYARAAAYPETFYGQLAAARLGRTNPDIAAPTVDEAARTRFAGRKAVKVIRRLEEVGSEWRAKLVYRDLAASLDDPAEIALLSDMAIAGGDHRLQLQVGKIALNRGLEVVPLAFPLGALPEAADTGDAGNALAYSVARQESAFNPAAVSPANARGLLQILPGTARGVASRHGLAYSATRLTSDPAYNTTLGAHYLSEQIDRFGNSYILTFVAYNAGPRKVEEWLARFGDPRGAPLAEVVDWIESIPYPETRNYVQHVLENYQIYKARLGQKTDIIEDLRFGRRG